MRLLLLLVFFLLVPNHYSQATPRGTVLRNDRVIVKPRTIVIVRRGKIVKLSGQEKSNNQVSDN